MQACANTWCKARADVEILSMSGIAAMLHGRQSRERQAERKLSSKSVRIYLSWVVKQPLLSGFVLVGRHRLRHLVSHRGAHAVQNPVQPHLHLLHTRRARRAQERNCRRGEKNKKTLECVAHELCQDSLINRP